MKKVNLIPLLLLLFAFLPMHAQMSDTEIDRQLTKIKEAFIKDVVVLSTAIIEASEDTPKHIFIRGYTMPNNHFQMRFPMDTWNEKSLQVVVEWVVVLCRMIFQEI